MSYNFANDLLEDKKESISTSSTTDLPVDFASKILSGERALKNEVGSGNFPPFQKPLTAISDSDRGADVSTSFVGGIPTDKQSSIKYFAEKRGISPSRYKIINGEVAYQAEDGKFYKEIAGPASTMAYYAPDVLETLPETAVGIASAPLALAGPAGVASTVALTGATSALSNLIRQSFGKAVSGQDISPLKVGVSGLLGGLPQAIPSGAATIAQRNLVKDIGSIDKAALSSILNKAKATGVELTPAEITNLSSLMGQQKVIGNIPSSSKTMTDFYEKRETNQIQPAVENFLRKISPVDDFADAGKMGAEALAASKVGLETAREVATDPLYTKAFELSAPVDVSPVVSKINDYLKTAKGQQEVTLTKIKNLLYTQKTRLDANGEEVTVKVLDDRLPGLQNAKFDIDRLFKDEAFGSMDKKIQRELTEIQKDLVSQMGKNNPEYLTANAEFSLLSKPIEEFNKRKTGTSLTAITPDNLNQFADRLFESKSLTAISYAKKQIQSADPDAWDAVTRAYLQRAWEKAKTPSRSQQGMKLDTGNTWQNMLLGDIQSQKAIRLALGPNQFKALNDLADVLQAAGSVKKLGSDTAFNAQILQQMKNDAKGDPVALAAIGVGTVLQPQNWGKKLSDWAVERRFQNDADKIAKIITSPDGISKLKELRQMSPTSIKRWAGMAQLLNTYGILEMKE